MQPRRGHEQYERRRDRRSRFRLAEQPFDAAEFPFAFLQRLRQQGDDAQAAAHGRVQQVRPGRRAPAQQHPHRGCRAGRRSRRRSPRCGAARRRRGRKAKFILATDGDELRGRGPDAGETVACAYADFPNHFGFFLPLAGISTVKQIRENPFDIRATSRLNKLYVELLKDNPDWGTAERRPT